MILLKRIINRLQQSKPTDKLPGYEGIQQLGHRGYVGGNWDIIGQLQYDFLLTQGLKPHHTFIDVACGALRAGVHLIPYLNKGNYLGIDMEEELVKLGIEKELGMNLFEAKQPEFIISGEFEFTRFSKNGDYAIAQSLFTHLIPRDIEQCMANLYPCMNSNGKFFVTFNRSDVTQQNPRLSHPHERFWYTAPQMHAFGEKYGWGSQYLGEWGHPGKQEMMLYTT
jgi:SAM-dependent methyltransferase